jgi:hypothetical protein
MFRSSANFVWSLRLSTGGETTDCSGAHVLRELYELGHPTHTGRARSNDGVVVRLLVTPLGPCEEQTVRVAAAAPAAERYFFDKTYRTADHAAIVQELINDPR